MVNLLNFFKDRKKVAAIGAAIIIILAIVAVSWIYAPDFWAGLGLRRDPKLEAYVDKLHSLVIEQHPQNLTGCHVAWLNNTAVKVTWGYNYLGPVNATVNQTESAAANTSGNVGIPVVNTTGNQTSPATANTTGTQTRILHYDESFVMTNFFSPTAASAYVGKINSNYTLVKTTYSSHGTFEQAFGHPPSTFAEYKKVKGATGYFIWQFDQFTQVGSLTRTYEG